MEKYRVNQKIMDGTGNPEIIFLHCLPAFHDTKTLAGQRIFGEFGLTEMDVSDNVFRSKASKVTTIGSQ